MGIGPNRCSTNTPPVGNGRAGRRSFPQLLFDPLMFPVQGPQTQICRTQARGPPPAASASANGLACTRLLARPRIGDPKGSDAKILDGRLFSEDSSVQGFIGGAGFRPQYVRIWTLGGPQEIIVLGGYLWLNFERSLNPRSPSLLWRVAGTQL